MSALGASLALLAQTLTQRALVEAPAVHVVSFNPTYAAGGKPMSAIVAVENTGDETAANCRAYWIFGGLQLQIESEYFAVAAHRTTNEYFGGNLKQASTLDNISYTVQVQCDGTSDAHSGFYGPNGSEKG